MCREACGAKNEASVHLAKSSCTSTAHMVRSVAILLAAASLCAGLERGRVRRLLVRGHENVRARLVDVRRAGGRAASSCGKLEAAGAVDRAGRGLCRCARRDVHRAECAAPAPRGVVPRPLRRHERTAGAAEQRRIHIVLYTKVRARAVYPSSSLGWTLSAVVISLSRQSRRTGASACLSPAAWARGRRRARPCRAGTSGGRAASAAPSAPAAPCRGATRRCTPRGRSGRTAGP